MLQTNYRALITDKALSWQASRAEQKAGGSSTAGGSRVGGDAKWTLDLQYPHTCTNSEPLTYWTFIFQRVFLETFC